MSSSWRDLTAEIGAMAFVIAAFYLLFLPRKERFARHAWPAWAAVGLFLLAILWSMWSETLRPLVEAGETVHALYTALGLGSIVLALLVLTYGGFLLVSRVLWTMHEESFVRNAEIDHAGRKHYPPEVVRAARRENLRLVFHAARPGCLWMAAAFLLMVLGAWICSLK